MLVPLRAARRAQLVGWLTVLGRTVATIAFFGQMALGVQPGCALWISLALGDLSLIVYVGASERSRLLPNFFTLSNPWAGAKWFSLTSLSTSAYQLDLPIVALFANAGAAGIYGGVNRWIQPMVLTTSAFASAAAPFIAAESDLRALQRQVLRASWILAATIVLSAGVLFTAQPLVIVLLGHAYANSAAVLQWLAAGMVVNTIALPLIVLLQSRRFDHRAAIIMLVSVGIQLIVVAAMAPTLGALSAGIGFFISQVLQLVGTGICIAGIVRRRKRRSESAISEWQPSVGT
jgi:O-antigen/teichoic acid export membrane protein